MSTPICRISLAELEHDVLETHLYPDLRQTFYWSDEWHPNLYVALARAGFIAIAHQHPDAGCILLPELQRSYAVLDWEDLHVSRHVRKILDSERIEREGIELVIGAPRPELVDALAAYHGRRCWLYEPYRRLLGRLPTGPRDDFAIHGVELRSRTRNELVAGELGYTIGGSYTSLTGFCRRDDPRWRHFGTLQLVLLARRLRDCGFAFWNLGHPHLAYKAALGARVLPRPAFLRRWRDATSQTPEAPLPSSLPAHLARPPGLARAPG